MHRVDTDGSVAGMWSDGNPATGTKGTKVDDDYMNALQEDLCLLLEAMGVTLTKGTWTQLRDSCVSAATADKIVRRDASGRARFADPSDAADAATKGYVDGQTGTISFVGTGWTGSVASYVKKIGSLVVGRIQATGSVGAAWNNIATLPVGFRPGPAAEVYLTGFITKADGVDCVAAAFISDAGAGSAGKCEVFRYDDGTSLANATGLTAPNGNAKVFFEFTFLA